MRIKKKFIFEIGWTQWPASLLEVVLSFESERSLFDPRTMAVKSVDLSLPVRRPKCSSATFRKKKNMHPTSVHSGFLKLKIFPNELSTEPWWRWNRPRCTQHFLPPLCVFSVMNIFLPLAAFSQLCTCDFLILPSPAAANWTRPEPLGRTRLQPLRVVSRHRLPSQ